MAVHDFMIEFQKIPYVDSVLEIEVLICGKGRLRASIDEETVSEDKLKSRVEDMLPKVFAVCSTKGIGYEDIHRKNEELLKETQTLLDECGEFQEGLKVESFTIMELYPADEEIPKIIEAKKRKAKKPSAAPVLEPKSEPPRTEQPSVPRSANNGLADEIRRNFTMKDKIKAIVYYRERTGAGLAEAKQAVEQILLHK